MPAGLGFMVQAILGMMGSQSLLHVGALSVIISQIFVKMHNEYFIARNTKMAINIF